MRPYSSNNRLFSGAFVLVSLMGSTACNAVEVPAVSAALKAAARCPAEGEPAHFFSADAISSTPERTRWLIPVYSHLLTTAQAHPFSCGDEIAIGYRLMVVPPFEPPLLVELIKHGEGWRIRRATFSGSIDLSQLNTGFTITVKDLTEFTVSASDAESFIRGLEEARFWSTPAVKTPDGNDLTAVTIEGRNGNSYRLVTRLTSENDPLEESARILLNLAQAEPTRALRKTSGSRDVD